MTTDKSDQGKPTCCGPGDISACAIETTEEQQKKPEANLPKDSDGTDETKNGGKA